MVCPHCSSPDYIVNGIGGTKKYVCQKCECWWDVWCHPKHHRKGQGWTEYCECDQREVIEE